MLHYPLVRDIRPRVTLKSFVGRGLLKTSILTNNIRTLRVTEYMTNLQHKSTNNYDFSHSNSKLNLPFITAQIHNMRNYLLIPK